MPSSRLRQLDIFFSPQLWLFLPHTWPQALEVLTPIPHWLAFYLDCCQHLGTCDSYQPNRWWACSPFRQHWLKFQETVHAAEALRAFMFTCCSANAKAPFVSKHINNSYSPKRCKRFPCKKKGILIVVCQSKAMFDIKIQFEPGQLFPRHASTCTGQSSVEVQLSERLCGIFCTVWVMGQRGGALGF